MAVEMGVEARREGIEARIERVESPILRPISVSNRAST